MDTPISHTNVSLRLSLIQKECEKLMEEEQIELTLEDPADPANDAAGDAFNPYDSSKSA